MAETDSADAESGFEEDNSEVGATVIKFVSRFVDKVCTDSGVTEGHIKALHQMIPGEFKYGYYQTFSSCKFVTLITFGYSFFEKYIIVS